MRTRHIQPCFPLFLKVEIKKCFLLACFLPADPGPCKGRKLRYYYSNDPNVKDCVAFMYGGCRGNGNNFESAEECVSKCRDPVSLRTTVSVAKKVESKTVKKIPGCKSEYGCCEDYVTPAKGPNQAGCPGIVRRFFNPISQTSGINVSNCFVFRSHLLSCEQIKFYLKNCASIL